MKYYLIGMSVITFLLYFVDKVCAIKRKYRVPEKVLLIFSFFGGAIGGYLSMILFHHKVRKVKFHIINILGLLLDVFIIWRFYGI